ncbi:MAG TPA: ABC transporter ATP-binding protein [Candidatus Limiplasma sp.]|nr:ABC transporter ATP-binding protein [Candidatus Limiplasma sp.]
MSVVSIQNLTRDYGGHRGVFDVSFAVDEGEAFGFLGPNGAGKTTTIRHLMGFLKPRAGVCQIGGMDCWAQRAQIQRTLGYVPGEIAFFDDMTGTEYLRFIARYRGMQGTGRQRELLERFDLNPAGRIKKMSKGMKQKLGIVAALMHDPSILILDEPTSGLDPLMQSRFIELVMHEKERGKTILMSSHMFEEVERTCHRVGIIRQGKLVAVDSVDALKAKQQKKYIITFENSKAAEAFCKEDLHTEMLTHHRVAVTVGDTIRDLIAALNRYPVQNLTAPNQSLEEIFLQYYGGEAE